MDKNTQFRIELFLFLIYPAKLWITLMAFLTGGSIDDYYEILRDD